MQTGSIKFGHKVWCDILVVKPKQPAAVNMALQEPVISESSKDVEEEKEEVSSFQPSDKSADGLMQSQITLTSEIKAPKTLYYEEVAKENDAALRDALTNLYEFGFTEYKVNKTLMLKHKNVNTVAEMLCNGVMSWSTVNEIYGEK